LARNLVIAPPTDLEYQQAEVQNIINYLKADVLIDDVDTRSVMDALSKGYKYVFIVAHGSSEGIQLEDGLLTTSTLIQLLRQNPPALLAINTCSSISIAVMVHEEIRTSTVGTIIDVPDREAYVTLSKLAKALGAGKDIATAYQVSKPSPNRTYVLLNGTMQMGGGNQSEDNARMLLALYAKLDRIEAQVAELELRSHKQVRFRSDQVFFFVLFWIFLFAPATFNAEWGSPVFAWGILSRLLAAACFAYTFGFINPGSIKNDGPN
jgi:hypothetical protein